MILLKACGSKMGVAFSKIVHQQAKEDGKVLYVRKKKFNATKEELQLGLEMICHNLPEVRQISIIECDLKHLPTGLNRLGALLLLNLSHNKLDNRCLPKLKEIVSIDELNIVGNPISNIGCLLRFPDLRILRLGADGQEEDSERDRTPSGVGDRKKKRFSILLRKTSVRSGLDGGKGVRSARMVIKDGKGMEEVENGVGEGLSGVEAIKLAISQLSGMDLLEVMTHLQTRIEEVGEFPTRLDSSGLACSRPKLSSETLEEDRDKSLMELFSARSCSLRDISFLDAALYPQLTHIHIADNNLVAVPEELFLLPSLLSLNVDNNCIDSVVIPKEAEPQLQELFASGNDLTQLTFLEQLHHLEILHMDGNAIVEIPFSIEKLEWLREIKLSNNKLTSIEVDLSQLDALFLLDLSYNTIVSISAYPLGGKQLEVLDVSHNQLLDLPESICALPSLVYLNCSFNKISRYPTQLVHLTKVTQFIGESNQFNDLPYGLIMCEMEQIEVKGCPLNDDISKAIKKKDTMAVWSKIRTLFLSITAGEAPNKMPTAYLWQGIYLMMVLQMELPDTKRDEMLNLSKSKRWGLLTVSRASSVVSAHHMAMQRLSQIFSKEDPDYYGKKDVLDEEEVAALRVSLNGKPDEWVSRFFRVGGHVAVINSIRLLKKEDYALPTCTSLLQCAQYVVKDAIGRAAASIFEVLLVLVRVVSHAPVSVRLYAFQLLNVILSQGAEQVWMHFKDACGKIGEEDATYQYGFILACLSLTKADFSSRLIPMKTSCMSLLNLIVSDGTMDERVALRQSLISRGLLKQVQKMKRITVEDLIDQLEEFMFLLSEDSTKLWRSDRSMAEVAKVLTAPLAKEGDKVLVITYISALCFIYAKEFNGKDTVGNVHNHLRSSLPRMETIEMGQNAYYVKYGKTMQESGSQAVALEDALSGLHQDNSRLIFLDLQLKRWEVEVFYRKGPTEVVPMMVEMDPLQHISAVCTQLAETLGIDNGLEVGLLDVAPGDPVVISSDIVMQASFIESTYRLSDVEWLSKGRRVILAPLPKIYKMSLQAKRSEQTIALDGMMETRQAVCLFSKLCGQDLEMATRFGLLWLLKEEEVNDETYSAEEKWMQPGQLIQDFCQGEGVLYYIPKLRYLAVYIVREEGGEPELWSQRHPIDPTKTLGLATASIQVDIGFYVPKMVLENGTVISDSTYSLMDIPFGIVECIELHPAPPLEEARNIDFDPENNDLVIRASLGELLELIVNGYAKEERLRELFIHCSGNMADIHVVLKEFQRLAYEYALTPESKSMLKELLYEWVRHEKVVKESVVMQADFMGTLVEISNQIDPKGELRERIEALPAGGSKKRTVVAPPPLPTKDYGAMFLDTDAKVFARQLTYLDKLDMKVVTKSDLIGEAWKDCIGDGDSALGEMVRRFNRVSYGLSLLVLVEKSLRMRVKMIRHAIQVAEHLRKIRNYHSLMAVLTGLNNISVSRLKWTFMRLPPSSKREFSELNEVMSMRENYKNYRQAQKKNPVDCIPYVGVTRFDLTFICDGNPTMIGGRVNVEKQRLLFHYAEEVTESQLPKVEVDPETAVLSLIQNLPGATDEALYDMSLALEPKNCSFEDLDP